jgi:hypothetical protein
VDAHRIAGMNLREVFTQLRLQGSHQSIGHDVTIPLSNPLHLAASIHFISNLVKSQPREYSIAEFALPNCPLPRQRIGSGNYPCVDWRFCAGCIGDYNERVWNVKV